MAIQLKIKERKVLTRGGGYVPSRMAVQVSRGRIPVEEVAERIEKNTSLGVGDVLNVLYSIAPLVAEYTGMGYSVELGRLGTFTPRVTAEAETDQRKEYSAQEHVRGTNIRFTPDRYLKKLTEEFTYEIKK